MLTVYGIETDIIESFLDLFVVATVLTVYGIETKNASINSAVFLAVATVLTVYGIETYYDQFHLLLMEVATVLTVYGIETL